MVLFCREICRMVSVYFEVLHIYHCLLALEFRNDGRFYGSLMINEISIDVQGASHQDAWDLFSVMQKGKNLQCPWLSALLWVHLVLNNRIDKVPNNDFKETSMSVVVMWNCTVNRSGCGKQPPFLQETFMSCWS